MKMTWVAIKHKLGGHTMGQPKDLQATDFKDHGTSILADHERATITRCAVPHCEYISLVVWGLRK